MAKLIWLVPVLGFIAAARFSSPSYAQSQSSSSSRSFSQSAPNMFYLGLGAVDYDMGRYSATSSGTSSLTSRIIPELTAAYRFNFFGSFAISPTIGYTVLGYKDVDTDRVRLLTLTAPIAVSFSNLDVHVGPGVLWYYVNGSGSGGQVTLPNGTGTSTFYTPNSSFNSRLLLVDIGTGYQLEKWRADLDVLVTDTLSTRRAVSTVLNISYGLFQ